jgi:hypothetical protein
VSYYTHVEFAFSDDPPLIDTFLAVAQKHLEAQNCYAVEDVLSDLRVAWEKGNTNFNGLLSQDFESLMLVVSAEFPSICFFVRGWGEEIRDIWVREFEAGKLLFSVGPFDGD